MLKIKKLLSVFEIGSPFYTVKVPFDPLFAQNWVPFLEFLGPLEIGEQCLPDLPTYMTYLPT